MFGTSVIDKQLKIINIIMLYLVKLRNIILTLVIFLDFQFS